MTRRSDWERVVQLKAERLSPRQIGDRLGPWAVTIAKVLLRLDENADHVCVLAKDDGGRDAGGGQ